MNNLNINLLQETNFHDVSIKKIDFNIIENYLMLIFYKKIHTKYKRVIFQEIININFSITPIVDVEDYDIYSWENFFNLKKNTAINEIEFIESHVNKTYINYLKSNFYSCRILLDNGLEIKFEFGKYLLK